MEVENFITQLVLSYVFNKNFPDLSPQFPNYRIIEKENPIDKK